MACIAASAFVVAFLILSVSGLQYAQAQTAAAAPAPGAAGSADYLAGHNAARAKVGVPALTWSSTLQAYASRYVKAQAAANTCRLLPPSGGQYGENKFWGSGKAWTPAEAVSEWVSSGKYYNATSNACVQGQDTCHEYTQVVWRSTSSLGCASGLCPDSSTLIMCSYYPAGNIVGQRPY